MWKRIKIAAILVFATTIAFACINPSVVSLNFYWNAERLLNVLKYGIVIIH